MDLVSKSQFIADSLLEKIRSKQLSGRIPSDKKIAEEYHVALMTAVRALKILERKGCVIRIPRKGTFTAEIQPKILKIFCNIAPLPSINGIRCTSAASETLAVTARATDPERLHELCELTLSPEFQQKVTQNKFGIAMDRGVAVNSMDTSARRDDFYFSEVKNIRFSHYDYELDTLQEIALLVTDCQKNVIGCAAFEKGLRKAIQMQIRSKKRRRRFSLLNGETDAIRKIVNRS